MRSTDIIDARKLLIVVQVFVAIVAFAFAAAIWLNLAFSRVVARRHIPARRRGRVHGAGLATHRAHAGASRPTRRRDRDQQCELQSEPRDRTGDRRRRDRAFGVDFPFWFNCAQFRRHSRRADLVASAPRDAEPLPAERLLSAVRTGLRYARFSPDGRDADPHARVLSLRRAYSALLPVVARTQLHNGPALYGALMGATGIGSIVASFPGLAEGPF